MERDRAPADGRWWPSDWRDEDAAFTACRVVGEAIYRFYFRAGSRGAGHIPPEGGLIVAPNHESLMDPVLLAYLVPRQIHYLVTRDFYDSPAFHWLISRLGPVPARPGQLEPSSLKQVLQLLADGRVVGMFPEGRITRTGDLLPGRPGIVSVARKARVPILPAGMSGTFESFPRWARFPKPRRLAVAFGPPVPVETLDRWAEEGGGNEAASARLMEEIARLREEARALRER